MFPNSDAPFYRQAFIGTCAVVAVAILSFLTLPFWLAREASARKRKTGHAMPLHAMLDDGKLHAALFRVRDQAKLTHEFTELSRAETSTQQIKHAVDTKLESTECGKQTVSVELIDHVEHPANPQV